MANNINLFIWDNGFFYELYPYQYKGLHTTLKYYIIMSFVQSASLYNGVNIHEESIMWEKSKR